MIILILLYMDAAFLTYIGAIKPCWYMWFLPLIFIISKGISNGIVLFSEIMPILSVPIMLLWIYAICKFTLSLGVL